MEKLINVGGVEVNFRATAATPIHYRNAYQRDLLQDMEVLSKELEDNNGFSIPSLEIFEKVAYIMAKSGANNSPDFPKTSVEWLDNFEMFSIYQILPELIELWGINTKGLNKSKKK